MSLFATEDGPTFSREYDSDSSCESEYEKECQEYQIILDKAIPNKNNLPINSYGIQYNKDMYLANDRYACFILIIVMMVKYYW